VGSAARCPTVWGCVGSARLGWAGRDDARKAVRERETVRSDGAKRGREIPPPALIYVLRHHVKRKSRGARRAWAGPREHPWQRGDVIDL